MATVAEPDTVPDPDNTALPTDYSDWSAEEEAAYQEWKSLWDITQNKNMGIFADAVEWCGVRVQSKETDLYYANIPDKDKSVNNFNDAAMYFSANLESDTTIYSARLLSEIQSSSRNTYIVFLVDNYDLYRVMHLATGEIVSERP